MVESKTVNFKTWCQERGHQGGTIPGQGRRSQESCEGPEEKRKPEPVPLAIAVWSTLQAWQRAVLASVGRSAEGPSALDACVLKAGCCFL